MAQANFDEFVTGASSPRRERLSTAVNIVGGLSSVALIIGVAVWGYQLAVRDVSGVPVIQAIDGPMRIAPENPGGEIAAHMGLSVTRVAEDGIAAQVPDEITLANRPVELADDDAAGIGQASAEEVSEEHARAVALAEDLTRTMQPLSSAGGVAPFGPPAQPLENPIFDEDAAAIDSKGGVLRSPRPQPRPSRASASVLPAPQVTAVIETDPALLAVGAHLAQIGAFDDPETARKEWDRVSPRAAALFEGKQRVIQPATSGGRTFHRLRVAGFADGAESRRFCDAIESSDLRCIPLVHK
ncbi:MAG: SPOR domain-containing protein [Gemmobacter sp.]|nr:SPOR domain-containing protein [Gemmobacter sp.]